jgi:hypothetical protein
MIGHVRRVVQKSRSRFALGWRGRVVASVSRLLKAATGRRRTPQPVDFRRSRISQSKTRASIGGRPTSASRPN